VATASDNVRFRWLSNIVFRSAFDQLGLALLRKVAISSALLYHFLSAAAAPVVFPAGDLHKKYPFYKMKIV
jgi:hypothetical protein